MQKPQPQNNQTNIHNDHSDEIDLRELIEVLLRGKWIILGITICAVLVAGMVSFFVLTPSYQASTVLLVKTPQISPATPNESLGGLLDVISRPPAMSIETYRNQVTNPVILANVIQKLNLDPDKYTVKGLQASIETKILDKTDLLQISVTGSDPAVLKQIADAIAVEFVRFIDQTGSQRIGKSLRFVEEQIVIEEAKLAEAVQEQKEFLAQPQGVPELQKEVNSQLTILTDFREEMIKNKVEIGSTRQYLAEARRQLVETPLTLKTQKSIITDPALLMIVQETTGTGIEDLVTLKMVDEKLNPLYLKLTNEIATAQLRLVQLQSRQDILQRQVTLVGNQLEKRQVELAGKQIENAKLSAKVALLRNNYHSFVNKHEESRIAKSLKMGETNIILLAPACEPVVPVGPRKMLNVAIAGVLGIMASVFFVFFLEFWRKSASNTNIARKEIGM